MVSNFAPPEKSFVITPDFTVKVMVNTPGPEDEYRLLNSRSLHEDFRSGPGALMQRNTQSLSPAGQSGRDEPAIRLMRVMEQGARRNRHLVIASLAPQNASPHPPHFHFLAARTYEALRPTQCRKIVTARFFCGETVAKLQDRPRIVMHGTKCA